MCEFDLKLKITYLSGKKKIIPNPPIMIPYESYVQSKVRWTSQLSNSIGIPKDSSCVESETSKEVFCA
jgi:hypothetical protein